MFGYQMKDSFSCFDISPLVVWISYETVFLVFDVLPPLSSLVIEEIKNHSLLSLKLLQI